MVKMGDRFTVEGREDFKRLLKGFLDVRDDDRGYPKKLKIVGWGNLFISDEKELDMYVKCLKFLLGMQSRLVEEVVKE